MGFRTFTVGHLDIRPRLNASEQRYLTAFADLRSGDPADRPGRLGDPPSGWCGWVPSCEGRCLSVRGEATDYRNHRLDQWAQYLIDTYLRRGAVAQSARRPRLAGFSFDHVVSGAIACHRSDTGELYLVRVRDNEVSREVVRRPDSIAEMMAGETGLGVDLVSEADADDPRHPGDWANGDWADSDWAAGIEESPPF